MKIIVTSILSSNIWMKVGEFMLQTVNNVDPVTAKNVIHINSEGIFRGAIKH